MPKERKLFCQRGKLCYKISLAKEYFLRDLKDAGKLLRGEKFASSTKREDLPVIVKGHFSLITRKLNGVEMKLQENKAVNLAIAAETIDGLIIRPGETFSFWRRVGKPTAKRGYLEGMTISGTTLGSGIGGGICQLANMIHWLVLNSPLEVTELHHHSDALFPDEQRRVPFGTGTSVFYKNVDYRFKNTSDQNIQLRIRIKDNFLYGELRAEKKFPYRYKITEEGHRFICENGVYYRCSRIYRETVSAENGETLDKELILKNHSRVMYDYSLIPPTEIMEAEEDE